MVKIGLEIHQRLATKHKLFCKCATSSEGRGVERKRGEIIRELHPIPSELGKIDIAAQFEQLKGKTFNYDVYDETVCLVEADEEPPLPINKEAIEIALRICKMMKAKIIDEAQVMRKIVLDGSAITSFQRTILIGMDGKIKINTNASETGKISEKDVSINRTINIPTICLEEESCGIVGEIERVETGKFRLDRLGIPLIEIATSADIKDGEEAKKVAEQIGLMLRATGEVQRGIGTIRQDLNISIEGGARVEIKGVQELELIEEVVKKEIMRQTGLIELCKKIKQIKSHIKPQIKPDITDVTDLFKKTGCKFVREAVWRGEKVMVAKFEGLAGIFKSEIYPNYRYGTELNGYAKVVGVGGIIHSDEDLKKYGFMEEIKEMEKKIKKSENDGWIMIVGKKELCEKALNIVYDRAYLTFVPEETRHVLMNGGSEYMRPLPGPARMYPETDIPPFRIPKDVYNLIQVPDFNKLKTKLKKILNEELAEKMLRSERLLLFEKLVERDVDPTLVATTLEDTLKALKREGHAIHKISEDKLIELFDTFKTKLFVKSAIPEILKELAKNPKEKVEKIVEKLKISRISGFELRKLMKELNVKSMQDIENIMRGYRLRVDIEELKQLLQEQLKNEK